MKKLLLLLLCVPLMFSCGENGNETKIKKQEEEIKELEKKLKECGGDNSVLINQPNNMIKEKQEIINSLDTEISEMEDKLEKLNNEQQELEKFARENFLMKKENEDIIIIKEE